MWASCFVGVVLGVRLRLSSVRAHQAAGPPVDTPPPGLCQAKLDKWCNAQRNCRIPCVAQQQLYALDDYGSLPSQRPPAPRQWRCYAANNTDETHTKFVDGGRCYCSREVELSELLCRCDPSECTRPPPPPPPPGPLPPPLPLSNSTYVVFNSSISPPGSRWRVACYRIPAIAQTADGLIAMAEARIGLSGNHLKVVGFHFS